jgi:hypothetical protein
MKKFEFNEKFTQVDFFNMVRDKQWLSNFMKENNVTGWPLAFIYKNQGCISW